jgi:molecular chaperone DnaK (HSP70)
MFYVKNFSGSFNFHILLKKNINFYLFFHRKNKSNPKENKRSVFKLKSNAEELKQILSTMERAHCSIDALYDGVDFDYYLTRQRFESVSSKLYQQVLQPIDDLLQKNNLKENQINQVSYKFMINFFVRKIKKFPIKNR